MVEYRLPKPWVTSSNLAIRSNCSHCSLYRELFCYAVSCEIRRLRSYLTPLCCARNRCPTSSAYRFAPADLVLHVSPSAPIVPIAPSTGSFFVMPSAASFESQRSYLAPLSSSRSLFVDGPIRPHTATKKPAFNSGLLLI